MIPTFICLFRKLFVHQALLLNIREFVECHHGKDELIKFYNLERVPSLSQDQPFVLIVIAVFMMLLCVSATDNRGQGTKKRSHVESEDDGDDQATENAHACD